MARLRRELEELQRDEKDRQETELKAIRERQKAVEDLERGVSFYSLCTFELLDSCIIQCMFVGF